MRKGQSISEFPTTGRTKSYLLDSVPLDFWRSVQQKARSQQRSIRHVVLSLLRDWLRAIEEQRVPSSGDDMSIRNIDGQYVLRIGGCMHTLTQEQFRVHCGRVIDICQAQILQRAS